VEGAIFYNIIAMIVYSLIVFGSWIKFEIYEKFVVFGVDGVITFQRLKLSVII